MVERTGNMKDLLSIQRIDHDSLRYRETVSLRYRILREPLGLGFTPEQLASESNDLHLAAYAANLDGALVGCLVLSPVDESVIKMRQVAVQETLQGRGIGTALVEQAEEEARNRGFARMVLSARDTAVLFYVRHGYEIIGEPYEEVSIPHRRMMKRLTEPVDA